MRITNTVSDALNRSKVVLDVGNGLPTIELPLDGNFGGGKGDPGEGVPTGGSPLQVVRKNVAGTATEWATPSKSMVGLSNVDNTADVDKPISNATRDALDTKPSQIEFDFALQGKADLVGGKVPAEQIPSDVLVNDANVAQTISGPETGAAIDLRINAQVAPQVEQITADYIASDQAVIDSAAAAVDANPTIATLLEKNTDQDGRLSVVEETAVFDGDTRLVETASTQDLSFAVVDADDRRTWLEADLSGNPSKHAAESVGAAVGIESADVADLSFAVVDADGRKLWMEADLLGNPTDRVRNLLGIGQGATALPSDDWAHWGDSLTDERVLGADGWVSKLAALTGKEHYNGGWYGQKAGEIAARQGGLPALVTLPGDTIPASGPVTVTAIRNSPVEVHTSLGVEGTLAGVHGFMQEPTTDVTTFTRSVSGDPVSCPPGTRFIPDTGTSMRNRVATIWVGRNDVFWTDPRIVVASIRAQIDYLSPSVKRVLVMEIVPSTSSPATHAQLAALNEAIKTAFPVEWVPIASWLRTEEAAVAAGITFTTDDQADIAAGITPTSFRMDGVHLNGTGCTAVAAYVFTEAQERGWLA